MNIQSLIVSGAIGAAAGWLASGGLEDGPLRFLEMEANPDPKAFFVTERLSPGFPCRVFPGLDDPQETGLRYVISRLGGPGSTWITEDRNPRVRVERREAAWVITAWQDDFAGERMTARRFIIADGLLCEDGTVFE